MLADKTNAAANGCDDSNASPSQGMLRYIGFRDAWRISLLGVPIRRVIVMLSDSSAPLIREYFE